MSASSTPAVIYTRKSTEEEQGRSVRQQLEALEEHAAREGWEVVARFEEVQSAYADRVRPQFSEAMAAAEEAGGVLLVLALDRFSRRGAEDVLRLFPRSGGRAPFRLVSLDGVDTARKEARFETIIKAELALQESERIGARIRRARADARKNGRWASGNAPFGYSVEGLGDDRRLVIAPDDAEVVRRMAAEVLDGASFRQVARGLNADGIASPQGKAWHPTTVRAILSNPATAGYLPRGTRAADAVERRITSYVRNDDGTPMVPGWPPLIEPEQWNEVTGRILASKRTGADRGGRPSKYVAAPTLLGPVLKCSGCGRTMGARRYKGERLQYVCGSPSPVPGVRHVTAEMERADEFVAGAVLRRLAVLASEDASAPEVVAVMREWTRRTGGEASAPERATVMETIEETRAAIERTARMMAEGLTPEDIATEMLTEYKTRLDFALARLAELPPEDPATEVLGWLADLAQSSDAPDGNPLGEGSAWAALDPDSQRAVIAAVVDRVVLGPGKSGGRYTPEEWAARFAFEWRTV